MEYYYTAFKAWESNFRAETLTNWMIENCDVPFYFMMAYIVMVFFGPNYMKDRKPWNLKAFFIIWNFILAVYSILGAYAGIPYAIETVTNHGFRYTLCHRSFDWWNKGFVGAWMGLFAVSKIPELVDTIFLVFQKKPVIFLHWYHHTTVMLYCWFAYITSNPVIFWFGTMNYFVHSIMYSYYFMMSLSGFTRSLVKPFNKLVTLLQIMQMVIGLLIVCVVEYYRNDGQPCEIMFAVHRGALALYSSYFVLFAKFFADSYIFKKRSDASKKRE